MGGEGFQVSARVSADPTVEQRLSVRRTPNQTRDKCIVIATDCRQVWYRTAEERIETCDKGSRQQEFENSLGSDKLCNLSCSPHVSRTINCLKHGACLRNL